MHRRRPRGSQGCRGLYSTHKEYAKSCRPPKNCWSRLPLRAESTSLRRRRPRDPQGCRGLYSTHKEYAKFWTPRPPKKMFGLDRLCAHDRLLHGGVRRVVGACIPHIGNTLKILDPTKFFCLDRLCAQGCRGLIITFATIRNQKQSITKSREDKKLRVLIVANYQKQNCRMYTFNTNNIVNMKIFMIKAQCLIFPIDENQGYPCNAGGP